MVQAGRKMTAPDLMRLGVVDGIVPEPVGGAHRDWDAAAVHLRTALREQLAALAQAGSDELVGERYEKFRRMGVFEETASPH